MADSPLGALVGTLRRTSLTQALDGLPDAELLARYRAARDEAAFATLVRRHGPLVLAACRQLLPDADADDAFQAAWLMFVREADTIRDGAAIGGWLYRVAYRIALRLRQRRERRRELGEASTNGPDLSWREACAILHEELDRLPDKFRLPLVLCYLDGRSRDEAARQLGWTEGMVKGRLERGRDTLRQRLMRRGVTLSAGLLSALVASRSEAVPPNLVNSVVSFVSHPASVPAALAALTHGVSSTMTTTRPWLLATASVLAAGLISGALLVATPPPADPPARPGADKPPAEAITLAGRVIDGDGKPVAGARLHWPQLSSFDPSSPDRMKVPERGRTDGEGRFHLQLPREDLPAGVKIPLVVAADGFGVGWIDPPAAGGTQDVTLPPERIIKGRIIDTQGQPVAGLDVRVVGLIAFPSGKLDEFLAAWKRDWQSAPRETGRQLWFPLGGVTGRIRTGADGRFVLRGVAAEQVAMLEISGPNVSLQTVYVVNRAGFDALPVNRAVREHESIGGRPIPHQLIPLAGPDFEHVATPTKLIEGQVKDARGGRPIAGARLTVLVAYGSQVTAVSDAEGRFKLVGVPKQETYGVLCYPPKGQHALLMRSLRIPDSEGLQPIRAEVELNHGVVITGQVIDRSTGKGVRAAVRFAPLAGNKYYGSKPGYDSSRYERLMHETDAAGKFRIVTIPGEGVLMAQCSPIETADGLHLRPWLRAELGAEEARKVKLDIRDAAHPSFTRADGAADFLDGENAARWLDVPDTNEPVKADLYLDRGRTQAVRILDPDGTPLAGAMVSGVTPTFPIAFPCKSDTCTIYGLKPNVARMVVAYHAERKLAGVLMVSGDEPGPLSVKLGPTATVKGRFIDMDGLPLAGVNVSDSYSDEAGRELMRFLKPPRAPVRTDTDGRFELAGVVPGLPFSFGLRRDRTYLVGEPRLGTVIVKPAQTLDLGSHRLKPAQ